MSSPGPAALWTWVLLAIGCALHRLPPTPDEEFERAVREYVEMRQEAIRVTGPIAATADPALLAGAVDALATQLQQLRAGFDQGVLLTPPLASRIRRSLSDRLQESDGARLRQVLADVEPTPRFAPRVNQRYPAGTPRTSTPAALLGVLPRLPSVLSYRFVGRDLLLLDRTTGLIIDFVDDALPPPPQSRQNRPAADWQQASARCSRMPTVLSDNGDDDEQERDEAEPIDVRPCVLARAE